MNVKAQEKTVLYYSANWEITKKKAFYTREVEMDMEKFTFNGLVADYNAEGKKVMEGNYSGGKRNGEFTFFFPNGKPERKG